MISLVVIPVDSVLAKDESCTNREREIMAMG